MLLIQVSDLKVARLFQLPSVITIHTHVHDSIKEQTNVLIFDSTVVAGKFLLIKHEMKLLHRVLISSVEDHKDGNSCVKADHSEINQRKLFLIISCSSPVGYRYGQQKIQFQKAAFL